MRLKLDLPAERWQFIKNKLEPFKNDSETITLFCHAIDSFDLEESNLNICDSGRFSLLSITIFELFDL